MRPRQPLLPSLRSVSAARGTFVATTAAVAAAAGLGVVGADSRWVAALGDTIVSERAVPDGVPFASASTAGWDNVLVAAELIFDWLDHFGPHGLLVAQVVAVAAGFVFLAAGARAAGATDGSIALVLVVVGLGALSSLVILRLQLFSLAFFPALLLLIRRDQREPSNSIWLAPPLVAIWGNLHGAVLVGYAVLSGYLLLSRSRVEPRRALLVWLASTVALLATPALLETVDYYRGVLTNEAAKRGVGLWAPLTLESPLDVIFIIAAVALIVFAARGRPQLWELAVVAGLAFLTVRTARSGVWLLFTLAAPAARGLNVRRTLPSALAAALATVLLAIGALGLIRGPASTGASERVLAAALEAAGGTPVLAQDVLAEQVALAGGRIWVGNPLDAFSQADQRLYLDWHEGMPRGDAALAHAPRVVFVHPDSDAERRLRARGRFRELARDDDAVVYGR